MKPPFRKILLAALPLAGILCLAPLASADHDDWLHEHPEAAQVITAQPRDVLWRQRMLDVQDFLHQLLR